MIERERRIRQKLKRDLAHYAKKCLRIRTKSGAVVPLEFNSGQAHLHKQIEQQKRETGRVRVLILKGRQMGISTYIQARFYHLTSHHKGTRAFILTHQDEATKNIFEMAQRFHDHCPELVKPQTGASSAKELHFDQLDSGYRVSTAGTKATGRSATLQYFHGSEVGFWPNAETHAAGALQAVPSSDGSEVLLESTSDGPLGLFHDMYRAAESGQSEYLAVFIPWFWLPEYRADNPTFEPTTEEQAYADTHGLDRQQLAWRRLKVRELNGVWNFRREYPATPDEAFAAERPGALWTRDLIERHRITEREVPALTRMVVGVDPPGKQETECGIVVAGRDKRGHGYVFRDESGHYTPNQWGHRVVDAYHDDQVDRVVAEENYGGDMVMNTIKQIDDTVAYRPVHAQKSKQARAEPVASLHEEGRVHFVGYFPALEDELVTWEPNTGQPSPNRLDAFVWTMTELVLKENPQTIEVTPGSVSTRPSPWRQAGGGI